MSKDYNQGRSSFPGSGGNKKPYREKKTMEELAKEVKSKFFDKGLDAELLSLSNPEKLNSIFNALERLAIEMSSGLTTSQLRNVYGKILQADKPIDLKLLRPNLAYVAARIEKEQGKKFIAFVDSLIQQVNTSEQQKAFNKVMEALVAYHKYVNSKQQY